MKSRFIAALVICTCLFVALSQTQNPLQTESNINPKSANLSEDWLDGWYSRTEHLIIGSEGAGVDYQIPITVHYGNGTSFGSDVYCYALCQTDFDDIRFTESDGTTLISHWREEYVAEDYAHFWIRITDDLSNNITIYMYYENKGASSMSNGTATFIFFDDFETGNLDRWTLAESNWNVQGSIVRNGDYAAFGNSFDVEERELEKNLTIDSTFLVHMWIREVDVETGNSFYFGMTRDQNGTWVYSAIPHESKQQYYNGTHWLDWPENNNVSALTWHRLEFAMDLSEQKQFAWNNRQLMGNVTILNEDGVPVESISTVGPVTNWVEGMDGWIDDYYVRKWIQDEPINGIWGNLISITHTMTSTTTSTSYETTSTSTMSCNTSSQMTTSSLSSTTSNQTSTSTTPWYGSIGSMISIIITIGSTVVIVIVIVLIIRNRTP